MGTVYWGKRFEGARRACARGKDAAMGDMRNMQQLLEEMDTELPDEELLYDLADLFRVFSDTTRIKILYTLMGKELRVGEIAEVIGATQSAVSHQLRTLKQAHLVKCSRDGKNVLYSLADDHVITMLGQGLTHICE
jgi:DNA-binding transcriptional ArsR family regulator